MRFAFAGALAALTFAASARGDDGKALTPFLDDRAFAVLRLDLNRIDVPKLVGRLTAAMKRKPAYLTPTTKEWSATIEGLVKDGAGVVYAVASLADVPDEPPFLVVPLRDGADAGRLTKRLDVLKKLDPTFGATRLGPALVAGSKAVLKRLQAVKPVPRNDLVDGLGKDAPPLRLVVGATTDAGRILEESIPELPGEIGGGSIRPLSRGLRWLRADVETAPRLAVRLTVQAKDAAMAEALDGLVRRVLEHLAKSKDAASFVPEVGKLTGLWKPRRDGARLVVTLDEATLVEALRLHVEQLLLTARMRLLAAAMLDHADERGAFPAQCSYDKSGKPLLSWRVHLLPFLGEDALYKEFRLGEPWDSPHNRRLLARMPTVYAPLFGEAKEPSSTHNQLFTGPYTPFPPGQAHGPRLASFRDGLRNTLLLVEAADPVPWTKPIDLVVDPKKPLPRLGAASEAVFFGVMADGTLRRFRRDFDGPTMRRLIDPDDGQPIDFRKVEP
jgi:hypothetical protein